LSQELKFIITTSAIFFVHKVASLRRSTAAEAVRIAQFFAGLKAPASTKTPTKSRKEG